MSSGDLSVPNRSWDKPSPLGLSAPASGYSMHPLSCIYRTLGPPATSPTWGPSGPRYPFAPLTPRGETSLFWKEMEWGQREQPRTSAAHTPAQLLRSLRGHLRPSLCHGSREQRPQGGMLDRFVPSPHPTYILSWVSGFTLIPLEARVALRALQETTSVG